MKLLLQRKRQNVSGLKKRKLRLKMKEFDLSKRQGSKRKEKG